jgi:hypothetical protein
MTDPSPATGVAGGTDLISRADPAGSSLLNQHGRSTLMTGAIDLS